MWIILEGCDGSGKSTLAAEITRQLSDSGHEVINTHLGPPKSPETAIEESIAEVFKNYNGTGTSIVSDRWGWGCPVYGPIYRPDDDYDGFGELGESGWRFLELFAAARGAFCVLVDVDPDTARDRIGPRGDDYIKVEHLSQIRERYLSLYDQSLIGSAVVRSTDPGDVAELATWIISEAQKEKPSPNLSVWPSYVGTAYPDKLTFTHKDIADQIDTIGRYSADAWKTVGLVPGGDLSFE